MSYEGRGREGGGGARSGTRPKIPRSWNLCSLLELTNVRITDVNMLV